MEEPQNLASNISLEQAYLQIGSLCEERARLNQEIDSKNEIIQQNKSQIDMIVELQNESVKLQNENAHLNMQIS